MEQVSFYVARQNPEPLALSPLQGSCGCSPLWIRLGCPPQEQGEVPTSQKHPLGWRVGAGRFQFSKS